MASSSSINSSVSTSSQAVNSGFPSLTHKDIDPYILNDLKSCEVCEVDPFLKAIMGRCRQADQTTPRIPQSASNPEHVSPASTDLPSSLDSKPEEPDATPNLEELFDTCMSEAITLCQKPELRQAIKEYQMSPKEVLRYHPFVKLANRILGLLDQLEISGLGQASDIKPLFHVNNPLRLTGKRGSQRSPDIVVVPLASAQRIRRAYRTDWKECAETDCPREQRNSFTWPEILMSVDMKWGTTTLDAQQPDTYDPGLRCRVGPLPTNIEVHGTAETTQKSGSTSTSARGPASTSSSSAPSGSSRASVPSVDGTRNPAGDSPKHSKRSRIHPVSDSSMEPELKKVKVTKNKDIKADRERGVLQAAISGVEMLGCSPGRYHSFSLTVIDSVVWIWRFDRQGPIQTMGIDFIQDLPRFILLLLAIQRFNIADWGFNTELDPDPTTILPPSDSSTTPQSGSHITMLKLGDNLTISFNPRELRILYEIFCLIGRSTSVFGVHSTSGETSLVAKLYWPYSGHLNEAEIIQRACGVAPDLPDHLPRVFGYLDFDLSDTNRIREEMGINLTSPRSPRILRIIVFEELSPITTLEGQHLVIAWLQCMRCHYVLWNNGIRHQDLSLNNLMVRQKSNRYYGVTNDWDLSHVLGKAEPCSDATFTTMFVARDLIRGMLKKQQPVRLYFHELESFLWVMLWVFFAVQAQKVRPSQDVQAWQTSNLRTSDKERQYFLICLDLYEEHTEWKSYRTTTEKLVEWLNSHDKVDKNETPDGKAKLIQGVLEIFEQPLGNQMPSTPSISECLT